MTGSELIKKLREKHGLDAHEVAEGLGISRSILSGLESGRYFFQYKSALRAKEFWQKKGESYTVTDFLRQ